MALFIAYAGQKMYKDHKSKKTTNARRNLEDGSAGGSDANQAPGDLSQRSSRQFEDHGSSSPLGMVNVDASIPLSPASVNGCRGVADYDTVAMDQCADTSCPPRYTKHASPVSHYPYSPDSIGNPNVSFSTARNAVPLALPFSPVPPFQVSADPGAVSDLKVYSVQPIGYFNPDPNGIFPTGASSTYQNIHSFTNALRQKGAMPEFSTLPQYVHMCLLGAAKQWYDTELDNVTRLGLKHSTIEDWCHFLEQRFSGDKTRGRFSHATANSVDTTASSPASPLNQYPNAVIPPATASAVPPALGADTQISAVELPASIPNAPGYLNPMEFSAELEGEMPNSPNPSLVPAD